MDISDEEIDKLLKSLRNKIKKEKLSDEFKEKLVKMMEEEYKKRNK